MHDVRRFAMSLLRTILMMPITVGAFQTPHHDCRSILTFFAVSNGDSDVDSKQSTDSLKRRRFLSHAAISAMGIGTSVNVPSSIYNYGCNCCFHGALSANALMDFTQQSTALADKTFDLKRNQFMDSIFSWSMANTMSEYEEEARPYKEQLFLSLFDSLESKGTQPPVIVEVGIGTFPNAQYFAQYMRSSKLESLDVIGIDPNDSMKQYALDNAEISGLTNLNASLRILHGVVESLPFEDNSVDAVVVTLTLCSVSSPERAVSEICRILKPGTGKFVFWEHVLSESDAELAFQQQFLSPIQTLIADGCHLNRRTGLVIQNCGGFREVDMHTTTMKSASIISPTIYGIARAS